MNLESALVEAIDPLGTFRRRHRLGAILGALRILALYVFIGQLAFGTLDCLRGLTVAAIRYADATQFTIVTVDRERNVAVVFDNTVARFATVPLPDWMRRRAE